MVARILKQFRMGLLLALAAAGLQAAEKPQDFKATYATKLSGFSITAVRELRTLDNGQQQLSFRAKSWFASIEEFSQFGWNGDSRLVPSSYEYHRRGLGRDRHAILTFDWKNGRVTNNVQNKPWGMDIPPEALDKLSYQMQLRSDLINQVPVLSYAVADGGHLKTYTFELLGEEVLDTPVGQLNTIKIKRTRATKKKRETYLWLAKDWNYLLVRLRQKEKDGKHYEINLAQAEIDGEQVRGF